MGRHEGGNSSGIQQQAELVLENLFTQEFA